MILSIASQKGGVGKTTTSISIAAGLAHAGKKVLLIDMDSQANSSKVLIADYTKLKSEDTVYTTIIDKKPIPVVKSVVPNLDIAPSHILLSDADFKLTTAIDHREARLKDALSKIKENYDHIIIDCPPALSWLTINAFTASDSLMVVTSPGYFELDSIVQLSKTMTQVQDNFNPDLKLLGILFTMSEPTNASKTSIQMLGRIYGELVFKAIVPKNTDLREAHMKQQDIFSYNPDSSGAGAYKKLIKEIFDV
jgi:chromosome partitioning protein